MVWGEYPQEYIPKIHGPYDPGRYYGKKDTPFGEVKLKDLNNWISRRNITPISVVGVISRAHWRWQHKYVQPRKCGVAPFFHIVVVCGGVFYLLNYDKMKIERQYLYHW